VLGIHPAVMTAYTARGDIDIARTVEMVDTLIGRGVHGLFIGGTAGEGPLQSVGERKDLTAAIVERAAGRVPVITHIGALPYRDTIELGRQAVDLGIRMAAIPPLYYAMAPDDILAFYRSLAADLGTAIIAYHVPHLTHRAMDAEAFATLAREGVLSGVKFSADDPEELRRVLELTAGTDFDLFSGSDPLCLTAARAGSSGAVGVSINAMPETFVALWDAQQRGDDALAERAQDVITRFVDLMFRYEFIAFLRHVLRLQGTDIGDNRRPLPNLGDDQRAEITHELRRDADLRLALSLS
jgi:N-acetylneuraminate lyase